MVDMHEHAQEVKAVYRHLTIYIVVNIALFLINWITQGDWWFYWVLIGWGIGLAVHAASVFIHKEFNEEWEKKQLKHKKKK